MLARRHAPRPGSAVVEFALVLPVFVMFLFGLIEIGRTMMTASLLTEAARVGCRAGVLPSSNNKAVYTAVTNKVRGLSLANPEINIEVNGTSGDVATAQTRDDITVEVSVDYSDVTWLPFTRWLGGKIQGRFSLPRE
jgi:Flp pilus assembly protein TadG